MRIKKANMEREGWRAEHVWFQGGRAQHREKDPGAGEESGL